MDQPLDNKQASPADWQVFAERLAAGNYDLRRLPRPESYAPGDMYDTLSDEYAAPEGMPPPPPIMGGAGEDDTDDDPLAFWRGLINPMTLLAMLATLATIWLTLWLLFGPTGGR